MIYQIGIGEYDNCYIITGGITGLTSFEPVLVNGDSEACSIIIDKKDDNIFSPWIKQSLRVSLVKENETDYAEIIAGEDNETFGILIENGELELVSDDLRITSGGKLKFIGTLALETYSEQFRAISVVKFTFHDRIGVLGDEDFKTNVQFKSIADVIACCIHSVIISKKLFLEWPYTLSSSDDPSETLLDLTDFDQKTNIEVLEQVLTDFGLQLKVDFEFNPQTNLVDCGAVRIISITEHPEQFITYWELNLSSFIASACSVEYFTYSGEKISTLYKTRNLINTNAIPLINNEANLNLERVASSIVAKNEINLLDTLVWRGVVSMDYAKQTTGTRPGSIAYKYCPFGLFFEIDNYPYSEDIYNHILSILEDEDISSLGNPRVILKGVSIPESTVDEYSHTFKANYIFCRPIKISHSLFDDDDDYKINVKAKLLEGVSGFPVEFHLKLLLKDGDGLMYQYKCSNDSSWDTFSTRDQLLENNQYTISTLNETEVNYDITINSTHDVVLFPVITSRSNYGYISSLEITPVISNDESMPKTITLTTDLSGNNRKDIEINPVFLNAPNVVNGELWVKNTIRDINNNLPYTIDYKSSSQTMLAHLSDQYGWQYNGNRWNIEGTCRVESGTMNLTDQFGLEEKVLILISGEYNVRRKELKGKWGQVLEIEEMQYRLLQDDFIPFTWDDGNYIMLN